MESNKDDAIKAKELAEKKLLVRDLGGARIFAMKAKDLYPDLVGLPQLLATIEVYISSEKRVNGAVDWYGVLGVQPLADHETIRKSYRNLARTLHPDKNKSVGADGAFSLITQAWSLLSDKHKRIFYDQNLNSWGRYGGIPVGKPSVPACRNGLYNHIIDDTSNWKDRDHRSATHPIPTPGSPVSLKQTFWTMCGSCRTQFEYHTVYINRQLVCNSCRQPFKAFEAPPPAVYRNASSISTISQMNQHNFNSIRMEGNYHASGRTPMYAVNPSLGSGHFSMPGCISSVLTPASAAAEAPDVYGMLSENLKRPREDSTPVMREQGLFGKTHAGSAFKSSCFGSNFVLKGDGSWKIRRTDGVEVHGDRRHRETQIAYQNGGIRMANGFGTHKNSFDTGRANAARNYKDNCTRDLSQMETKNMLMDKALKEIRKVLDAYSVSRNLGKSKNTDAEVRKKNKEGATKGVKLAAPEFVDSQTISSKCFSADSEVTEFLSMSVPDPDFHDFDRDRIENAFGENQVWAVYDDDDGMPRYYALINSVISKKPFKMKIRWLNSKTNDELAPIKWVSSGFPKTVGDLRIGKCGFSSTLNSFSHMVKWTKGSRGTIHIYPKKGDVWALYRNWSLDWNEFTADEIIHKYVMVEVLEDYSEGQGVNVAPLVKVAGFKTVFRQNADTRKIMNIPKEEMFRLSHQVPSYLLTGQEGHNAPRGCLELDPAATPMELLQVLTEDLEQEMVMTMSKSLKDALKPNVNSTENSCQTTKEAGSVEDVSRKEVTEAMGKKEGKPEILFVYKRKRQREKKAL